MLEVLTAEYGRLSLVARGARRKARGGSSGSALLQPFIPLLLSFSGRAELKNLTAKEAAGKLHELRGERLFSAMYVNELLVRLLHRHDPHPQLFAAYTEALQALARNDVVDTTLRHFEFKLLDELGYSFDLALDAEDKHDRIFIDVPGGASSLTVAAEGASEDQRDFIPSVR